MPVPYCVEGYKAQVGVGGSGLYNFAALRLSNVDRGLCLLERSAMVKQQDEMISDAVELGIKARMRKQIVVSYDAVEGCIDLVKGRGAAIDKRSEGAATFSKQATQDTRARKSARKLQHEADR